VLRGSPAANLPALTEWHPTGMEIIELLGQPDLSTCEIVSKRTDTEENEGGTGSQLNLAFLGAASPSPTDSEERTLENNEPNAGARRIG
jgi:hypothetical protein